MALKLGLEPDAFWALSIGEIEDVIKARTESRIERMKELISIMNTDTDMLSRNIGKMLTGNVETRTIYDYYPQLFGEEKNAYQEARQKAELERHKAEMIARMAMRKG